MRNTLSRFVRQLRLHWKRILLYGIGSASFLIVVVQLLYPTGQLLPYARADDATLGGWQKADAAWELDRRYLDTRIQIYFGSNATPYRAPTTGEVGIIVKNQDRIDQISYPWWLRLVPTSIVWAHKLQKISAPEYEINRRALDAYISKELGQSCNVLSKDASLKYEKAKLQVIESELGGTCQPNEIKMALEKTRPSLIMKSSVRIAMTDIQPAVTTAMAQKMAAALTQRIGAGVAITADKETVNVPADQVMSWMDFTVEKGTLIPRLSNERAADFLTKNIAPNVAVAAGVTKVTTLDFIETDRQDGPSGRELHIENTLSTVAAFIRAERDDAIAVTSQTDARVEYTRNYSPTDAGLSALLANFAKDNTGTFGISYIELSGKNRRATYNENKTFVTASTYKLFVAFSTLKRVDSGVWSLRDENISNGRNLEKCLDDMIVKSDNACAEALLKKVGYRTITDEVKAIGLQNSSFLSGDSPVSTAADEALFMAQLESKQLSLSPESHSRFIDMLKRNIYRRGIPAGASGAVANKVGFMSSLLHDASIVYSPSGTYVLVIMSDGSSWGALADLTRQLEALRSS